MSNKLKEKIEYKPESLLIAYQCTYALGRIEHIRASLHALHAKKKPLSPRQQERLDALAAETKQLTAQLERHTENKEDRLRVFENLARQENPLLTRGEMADLGLAKYNARTEELTAALKALGEENAIYFPHPFVAEMLAACDTYEQRIYEIVDTLGEIVSGKSRKIRYGKNDDAVQRARREEEWLAGNLYAHLVQADKKFTQAIQSYDPMPWLHFPESNWLYSNHEVAGIDKGSLVLAFGIFCALILSAPSPSDLGARFIVGYATAAVIFVSGIFLSSSLSHILPALEKRLKENARQDLIGETGGTLLDTTIASLDREATERAAQAGLDKLSARLEIATARLADHGGEPEQNRWQNAVERSRLAAIVERISAEGREI